MNAFVSLLLVSLCGIANAIHLPVVSRSVSSGYTMGGGRSPVHMAQVPFTQNIENARDVAYATNITLGGQEFLIQLDTGSSDLWVSPPSALELTGTTDVPASLVFGIGQVNGTIAFANMSFGPYEVSSQAFLNATNATNFGAIFNNGIRGILGLAFDTASTVFIENAVKFNNTKGLTFLSNVFQQNKSAPNFFSVLLGRSYDNDGPEEGAFTISEYVDGFEAVANQPKLLRTPAQTNFSQTLPRWTVQMDGMTVNGQAFQFNQSSVPEADPGKQVVVLDTGFTFSQIPPEAVNFIYSSIPGAVLNQTTGRWVVPCNSTTELSFQFGNATFHVHPLDITTVSTDGNQVVCLNAYQPISFPPGTTAGLDFVMGDSFIKNAYIVFDYGDFTPDNRTAGVPFVQMLPTTNITEAMEEFQTIRTNQVMKQQQALVAAAPAPDTGALVTAIETGLKSLLHAVGIAKRAPEPQQIRVIYTSTGRIPVRQRVAGCMKNFTAAHGPIVTALLFGSLGVTVIGCVVGAMLLIRMLLRSRIPEGYGRVELKEDVIFDADQA